MLSAVEIEAMLRATGGVQVVAGAETTWGHYEIVDEALYDTAQVIGAAETVLIATGRITTPAVGSPITVAGTTYTVRDARREDDGALLRIWLARS